MWKYTYKQKIPKSDWAHLQNHRTYINSRLSWKVHVLIHLLKAFFCKLNACCFNVRVCPYNVTWWLIHAEKFIWLIYLTYFFKTFVGFVSDPVYWLQGFVKCSPCSLFQTFNYETFSAVWIFGHNNNHLDEKNTHLTGNSDLTLKSLMTVNW